jgi:hypothetical protein
MQKQVKTLLKEEVYGNKAIVYHRTKLNIEQLKDIFFNKKWSFGSNAGSMYGAGLYTTYSLESQMNDIMIDTYGENLIKFSVNLKNFLICDYKEFQKTPQYQRLNKPKEKDENGNLIFIIEQLKEKNIIVKELYSKNVNYSSDVILHLLNRFFTEIKTLFNGIMYTGNRDGKCCLVFSNSIYDAAIPLGYYTPKNDSPRSINDYKYISSFNKDNSNFKNVVNDKLNKNLNINLNNNNKIDINDYLQLIINKEIELGDVPEKYRTRDFCTIAVTKDGNNISSVPEDIENYYSLCEIAVSQKGYALLLINKKYWDYNLCEKAVSKNGEVLHDVPDEFIDYHLCYIAVSNEGLALSAVPIKFRDYNLCDIAVSNEGLVLKYVPKNLRDYALCEKAFSNNIKAVDEIPAKYKFDLIIDFPEYKEYIEKNILQEFIFKEVRKLLKEYLFK